MTPAAFVKKYGQFALKIEKETGVNSALILAQAAHESAWGNSAPGFNFFGIKGSGPAGSQNLMTTENVNGRNVRVRQSFRKYNSPEESFRDHARLISTSPNYRGVMAATRTGDIAKIAQAIGDSPYATDPQYGQKILSTMSKLGKFTDELGRPIATSTPVYEKFKENLIKPVMAQETNGAPTEGPYPTMAQQFDVGLSAPSYTVKKGDTLWDIAQERLGSGFRWKELGYTGDPRKLQIGTQLNIPVQMPIQMPTPRFQPRQAQITPISLMPQSITPSAQPSPYQPQAWPQSRPQVWPQASPQASPQSWPQSITPSAQPPVYSRPAPRPAPTPQRSTPPAPSYSPPKMWYQGGTAQGPQPGPRPTPVPTPSAWY